MTRLSSAAVLRFVDSMAILLSQAYQLARARLSSAGSPILRLLVQRDQAFTEVDLLRREVEILRAQREGLASHRRPDYRPEQRPAILQLRRLRGWSIRKTAEHFVLHRNTIRSWVKALEGKGWPSLLTGAAGANEHRPHSALHGLTLQEASEGHRLSGPVRIRARDQLQPQIEIRRRHYRGDPRLPIVEISARLAA